MPDPVEHDKLIASVKEEVSSLLVQFGKKASPTAVSALILIGGLIVALGGFIYFNKDTILEWQKTGLEVRHLKIEKDLEHDHCQEQIAELKERVGKLETEVKETKHTAQN